LIRALLKLFGDNTTSPHNSSNNKIGVAARGREKDRADRVGVRRINREGEKLINATSLENHGIHAGTWMECASMWFEWGERKILDRWMNAYVRYGFSFPAKFALL
jgi:hypothetical protein